MKRIYTNTEARLEANKRKANWEKRLEIMRLRGQGWTFRAMAKMFKERDGRGSGVSVFEIYNKIKKMSIKELEAETKKVGL